MCIMHFIVLYCFVVIMNKKIPTAMTAAGISYDIGLCKILICSPLIFSGTGCCRLHTAV